MIIQSISNKFYTCAIITRGFFIHYPIFEDRVFLFKEFFQNILSLCMVSIQERFVLKSGLWWCTYVRHMGSCKSGLWFLNLIFSVLAKNEAETTLKKKQQELLSDGKKQGGMHASEDHLKKAKILNREVDSNTSFRYNWHNKWVTKVHSC